MDTSLSHFAPTGGPSQDWEFDHESLFASFLTGAHHELRKKAARGPSNS